MTEQNAINQATTEQPTATHDTTGTVMLDYPLQRGKTEVTEIHVRKPKAGALRGVSLVDLMNLDVAALTRVLPRVTTPSLSEQEIRNLDVVDLVQLGTELAGFFVPKKMKAETDE